MNEADENSEDLEQERAFREQESTEVRTAEARLSIDPGFVHHRLIQNAVGKPGVEAIDVALAQIPPGTPDHVRNLQIDHVYVDALITLCSHFKIPSLRELLAKQEGRLFCSIEMVAPCPEVYTDDRVTSEIILEGENEVTVRLEYATAKISADTTRYELSKGGRVAIVGHIRDVSDDVVIVEPLVIGGPSLEPAHPEQVPDAMWLGYSFGQVFAEDIDEFAAIREEPMPDDIAVMGTISEEAFKTCLAELLGQTEEKDWGGEQSDLYSAHLHLGGRPATAAFLLKGPARFTPMRLTHLGKNNDQIVRLANEPADLLVVQHAHEIRSDVRATLRAFATSLGYLRRRYCFIDGADSLRILTAYDKLERALELSAE